MKNLIIIIGILVLSLGNLFGQNDTALIGTWIKGEASIKLDFNNEAEFRTAKGKVIKGTWRNVLIVGKPDQLVINSKGKNYSFDYSLESTTEILIGKTGGDDKYRFTKDNILLNTIFADTSYGQNTTRPQKVEPKTTSSMNSSDEMTTALILGGGMWLLDVILGGNSSSTNQDNTYSSDPNTNRIMRNWAEQESYERNH